MHSPFPYQSDLEVLPVLERIFSTGRLAETDHLNLNSLPSC
jgi:hypothetical protein